MRTKSLLNKRYVKILDGNCPLLIKALIAAEQSALFRGFLKFADSSLRANWRCGRKTQHDGSPGVCRPVRQKTYFQKKELSELSPKTEMLAAEIFIELRFQREFVERRWARTFSHPLFFRTGLETRPTGAGDKPPLRRVLFAKDFFEDFGDLSGVVFDSQAGRDVPAGVAHGLLF
jgi:hypothetical protein